MNETVLVVDDEERIRSSLRGILSDEGFRVLDTGNSTAVLEIVEREQPSLVLLDVWMPEMDGIELLRQIKTLNPGIEVIMISGHANIQSAVAAIKLGAAGFIEKPFSVTGLLAAISRALGENGAVSAPRGSVNGGAAAVASSGTVKTRRQKTIAKAAVIGGQGLHSGFKTGVILHPAPIGSGISFTSLSDDPPLPALLENVTATSYNTTLSGAGLTVRTVEHLMSVLHAAGITNLLVKTQEELPAFDGSAAEFCKLVAASGVEEQNASIAPITLERPIAVGDQASGEFIQIEPAETLTIDYTLEYPHPVGRQVVHFELDSFEGYASEIAPARTFGFVREIKKMSEMGLASGGRLDNVILVDDERIVNTQLRFADEFARHKVLDLIGDLYLLGRPILGHVVASKTGHSDNVALVRAISRALGN